MHASVSRQNVQHLLKKTMLNMNKRKEGAKCFLFFAY